MLTNYHVTTVEGLIMIKKLLIIPFALIMFTICNALLRLWLFLNQRSSSRMIPVQYNIDAGMWYCSPSETSGIDPYRLSLVLQRQLSSPKYFRLLLNGPKAFLITNHAGNMVLGVVSCLAVSDTSPKVVEMSHIPYCLPRIMAQLHGSKIVTEDIDVYSINGSDFTLTV